VDMGKPLSMDLRSRVLDAIRGGLSCREAAARFDVSAASAIRWRQLELAQGHAEPKRQGGDRRSGRIEALEGVILELVRDTPDMTLAEIQSALDNQGEHFGIGTLWRFFDRHGITLKKSPFTLRSSSGPRCSTAAGRGLTDSLTSIRRGLCSSMRPGRPRR